MACFPYYASIPSVNQFLPHLSTCFRRPNSFVRINDFSSRMEAVIVEVETDDACCLTPVVRVDSVSTQTSRKTQELLQKFNWLVWSHSPYSPDWAPSDYLFSPALKKHLSEPRFTTDSDVQTDADRWINGQELDYYQDGLSKLVQ
ncbi:uncharacterized protein TNCV_2853701 [Trichonephila clavipes]|uniref:Uncharacterized protein n=1 Tax=Trichonephila clavipes TaxID=2585209 RepID=A0A8X6UR02_TRICX|nr:uncharacterized protein TNCV_2853701 [Trichonephila clavipes]